LGIVVRREGGRGRGVGGVAGSGENEQHEKRGNVAPTPSLTEEKGKKVIEE